MTGSEWAPSRFRLAMFRLIALVRLSAMRATGPDKPPRYLSFTGGQGPWEVKLVSAAWFTAFTLFITAEIDRSLGSTTVLLRRVPLFALSMAIAFVGLLATATATGAMIALFRRARIVTIGQDAVIQAAVHHVILIAASLAALWNGSWSRWVGLIWLACVGLNLAAALMLRVVRRRVAEIEARFGERAQVPPFGAVAPQDAVTRETGS